MRTRVSEHGSAERPLRSHIGIPYWPAAFDDLGLDPYDTRVFLRVARRAGLKGHCTESIRNMARGCLMSVSRVQEALALLRDIGIIEVVYPLTPKVPVRYRMPSLERGDEWDIEALKMALKRALSERAKLRSKRPSNSRKHLCSVK